MFIEFNENALSSFSKDDISSTLVGLINLENLAEKIGAHVYIYII